MSHTLACLLELAGRAYATHGFDSRGGSFALGVELQHTLALATMPSSLGRLMACRGGHSAHAQGPHLFGVHVQRAQDEDDAAERGVGRHSAQPVVVQVEQHHLVLGGLEDEVTKLLQLDGRCGYAHERGGGAGMGQGALLMCVTASEALQAQEGWCTESVQSAGAKGQRLQQATPSGLGWPSGAAVLGAASEARHAQEEVWCAAVLPEGRGLRDGRHGSCDSYAGLLHKLANNMQAVTMLSNPTDEAVQGSRWRSAGQSSSRVRG